MNIPLVFSKKIEIKGSPIEGFGVFATDDIAAEEVLEEVPFILMPKYTSLGKSFHDFSSSVGYCASKNKFHDSLRQNLGFKDPEKYYFTWVPPQPDLGGERVSYQVLPLGFGCIYNTANAKNNAGWRVNQKTFTFYAIKDIIAGEEIRTFYGYFVDDSYRTWNTDLVFYLGIETDTELKRPIFSAFKFNNNESYEKKKHDPGYLKMFNLLEKYKDLKLESVSAISPFGEVGLINDNVKNIKTSAEMYALLATYKGSNAEKIKIKFSNFQNEEIDEAIITK